MRVKELYIKAFGRFSDKRIVLGDNLNIIYGLNEKGKSTIHRFIEAMLFGFVKPGVKRRVMMEEYDLYRPWTGDLYEGSLIYETGGRRYKVERNMVRGREGVRVFDDISGEEITQSFMYDKARKELLFARQHLGLNQTIFRNTISISQLGSKSDARLAREIQTRLGNLCSAGDADISVSRAEKLIKEYLDGIGTDRAYSKEYGRLCRQTEELEEGIEASAAAVEDLRSLGQQIREAETKAEGFKAVREQLEQKIKNYNDSMLLKRWAEIQRLVEEQQSLTARLDSKSEYSGFDTRDSEELFTLDRLSEQNRREIIRIKSKIDETSVDIAGLGKRISERDRQDRGEDRKLAGRGIRISYLICIAAVLAAVGAAALAAASSPALYTLLIPLACSVIYCLKRASNQKRRLKELEAADQRLELERQYMEKYSDDLRSALSEKEEGLKEHEDRISAILTKAGTGSTDGYRDKLACFKRYTGLQSRLEETNRLLNIRLDGETFDAVRERALYIQKTAGAAGVTGAGDISHEEPRREELLEWQHSLERVKESQAGLMGSIEKTRGSIETLQQSLVNLPEMEEELSKARERLEHLKQERAAAQKALEIIREASAEVHREFAPLLNRKVGEITAHITGGRYSNLRVDGNLEILAAAPETGRQVKAGLLSGGTIDQFYFALRMAASELLSGEKHLPLFLDDSFVQHDVRRLRKVMEYLLRVSKTRQIIIFTCHSREKEVADRLGGVYNYLEIE
jgi:hypothetical protein